MNKINVLLVEDETVLAAIVKESLEKRDFNIHVAPNGVEGWELFKQINPHICIIDVMLPRKDGFSLVSDIRMVNDLVPIVFLTARTRQEDVLKGLELGADDYIRKPFSMEELILRIKALARRVNTPTPEWKNSEDIPLGIFRFHHQRQTLTAPTGTAELSQREADLLLLLIQHKNRLLERKMTLIKLWGEDDLLSARSMDVYITKLRKLLKADPSLGIINVRGKGYSLLESESGNA